MSATRVPRLLHHLWSGPDPVPRRHRRRLVDVAASRRVDHGLLTASSLGEQR